MEHIMADYSLPAAKARPLLVRSLLLGQFRDLPERLTSALRRPPRPPRLPNLSDRNLADIGVERPCGNGWIEWLARSAGGTI
jgi:hypothetical protein